MRNCASKVWSCGPSRNDRASSPISPWPQNALWCPAHRGERKRITHKYQRLGVGPVPLEGKLTRYISTRGEAPVLGFCDVMLTGLARDGGLYVPETWPQLSPEAIGGLFGRPSWQGAGDGPHAVVGG